MLGELFASQMHHYLVHTVMQLESDAGVSYVGDPRIGAFFKAKIFAPGKAYHWNTMIRRATGEPLTAKYFVDQFIQL
jgi:peptidyl-dipeptidase A